MVKATNILFENPKKLPTLAFLKESFGIDYDSNFQQFNSLQCEIKMKNCVQILAGGMYSLQEFIDDYYEMDFVKFRSKFNQKLKRSITADGFIQNIDGSKENLPIRDFAMFANKQR